MLAKSSSSFSRIVRIIFDCIINFCVCLLYEIREKAATRDVLQLNFESFFLFDYQLNLE